MIRSPLLAGLALALLALPLASPGQTAIGGALSDTNGGPLLGGVTYDASSFQVMPGETLTIMPGAIIKFRLGASVQIAGTLLADGATFTSQDDDSIGVDLSGPGTSTGTVGYWVNLAFQPTSGASVVSNCTFRYGGRSLFSVINLTRADCTFTNTTILDCGGDGFDMRGNSSPTLTGCDVQRCRNAYMRAPLSALPGFTSNSVPRRTGRRSSWNTMR